MTKLMVSTAVAVLLGVSGANAATADFSFTGNFSSDDEVQLFNFSISATSTVTLISYSYAGGVMADGTIISPGGFDPILALWDSTGALVNEFDDGPEPVGTDPVTGSEYDTHLILPDLAPGTYTASIAQYANFAAGSNLTDGFSQTGNPTFTSTYGCTNGQFCDVNGDNRTSFWAFDVRGVETAVAPPPNPVPLPGGLVLLISGLLGAGAIGRLKKTA